MIIFPTRQTTLSSIVSPHASQSRQDTQTFLVGLMKDLRDSDAQFDFFSNNDLRMALHKAAAIFRLDLLTSRERSEVKAMLVDVGSRLLYSTDVTDARDIVELLEYRGR